MYTIKTTNQFEKTFKKMDKETRDRIVRRITQLKENPYRNTKKLHGELQGLYSLRIGDHRAMFSLDEEKGLIILLSVGHRKSVYKE
ncbi:type II toxin-antitoxin system mRNA interferase toxin, RelE/StbE family [Thermococci archaeon]|nr:MAG: type II toxin-antitoxin system mRNA interferase toxin, RelE/StbE family [Thermococci archaeon]